MQTEMKVTVTEKKMVVENGFLFKDEIKALGFRYNGRGGWEMSHADNGEAYDHMSSLYEATRARLDIAVIGAIANYDWGQTFDYRAIEEARRIGGQL